MEDIEFIWNGSFAGINHRMIVHGKEYRLGGIVSDEDEAKEEAIRILKNEFNITYDKSNIKFGWGGQL